MHNGIPDINKFTKEVTPWLFEYAIGDAAWSTKPVVESSYKGYLAVRYDCLLGSELAAHMGRDELLYHGTWGYAARNLIKDRQIRGSHDVALGHDYGGLGGVFSSPNLDTARSYARPS